MTSTDILRQQIAEVARRRAERDEHKARVAALRAQFEADIAPLVEEAQIAAQACSESEEAARQLVVAIYETTGEKKPLEGAAVRVSTKLQYDKEEAFAKAKAMGVAIVPETLDVKAFEKIAKASPDSFPFVQVVEEPSATLASDLSAYLTPVTEPTTVEAPF